MEYLAFVVTGFALGLTHSFDVDHIAAMAAIANERKGIFRQALVGMSWGLGHTTTLFVIGMAILLFGFRIPEKLALPLEAVVGAMLVLLGVFAIKNTIKQGLHTHEHEHNGITHRHVHSHLISQFHQHTHEKKSFFIGVVHGLAGSAGVMLLVLSTTQDVFLGTAYVLLFGIGLMLGMAITVMMLSFPLRSIGEKNVSIVKSVFGLFSILIGISIVFEVVSP